MTDGSRNDSFRPIVGIDLGTTNSAVAYIRNGRPEIISDDEGEKIIPSVVLIDLSGKTIIGRDARDALVAMPERTIAAVKRSMGSGKPLILAGKELLPQEISALILKKLKMQVDALYGEGDKEAVITVPAYFTDEQRKATKEAGQLAGFIVERIINEPTAAAMAYGLQNMKEDRHILVYDLGGGTFDVSVVEMMSGILEVKSSAGNRLLGGEDFDWRLVDWLAEQMIAQNEVDPRKDIRARALLKQEAERVKVALSSESQVNIELPLVTVKDNVPVGLYITVTRQQFEVLIEDLLTETMNKVGDAVREAGLNANEIHEILLVGGSSRIPKVHQLIQEFFGKKPREDINPDEAVALGAAVQAGLKSGALANSGLIVTDVAPFSMGVAALKSGSSGQLRPGGFVPIIPRNTTIPVTRSQSFYTAALGQTSVSVEVYQGEHEWVKNNHLLGDFLMEGIPENWNNPEEIEVTFRYNLNGILEVSSRCVSTNQAMTISVQDAVNRESREAFEESVKRLEQVWEGIDTDDNLEDEDPAEWDLLDEPFDDDSSLSELRGQAIRLRERAESLLANLKGADLKAAKRIIEELNTVLEDENMERLSQAIDDATDTLIDLEI